MVLYTVSFGNFVVFILITIIRNCNYPIKIFFLKKVFHLQRKMNPADREIQLKLSLKHTSTMHRVSLVTTANHFSDSF